MLGIYTIKNLTNGKQYVGSSINIKDRWNRHKKMLRKNKHPNKHLQCSWNKYGKEHFIFEILEEVEDKKILLNKEQKWMDEISPEYNIRLKAESNIGLLFSQEHKDKIKSALLGNKNALGSIRSIKTRKQIGDAFRGEKGRDAKLTWKQAREIRKLYKEGKSQASLGRKFGVHRTTILRLLQGKTWKE